MRTSTGIFLVDEAATSGGGGEDDTAEGSGLYLFGPHAHRANEEQGGTERRQDDSSVLWSSGCEKSEDRERERERESERE